MYQIFFKEDSPFLKNQKYEKEITIKTQPKDDSLVTKIVSGGARVISGALDVVSTIVPNPTVSKMAKLLSELSRIFAD